MDNFKRISNRRYLEKSCKQCLEMFIPHDARQLYCSEQHRNDHGNDKRKIKNAPYDDVTRKLKKNEAILKKFYTAIEERRYSGAISIDSLNFEGFNFETYVETAIYEGRKVFWMTLHGIKACENPEEGYHVIKKNFL